MLYHRLPPGTTVLLEFCGVLCTGGCVPRTLLTLKYMRIALPAAGTAAVERIRQVVRKGSGYQRAAGPTADSVPVHVRQLSHLAQVVRL